MLAKLTQLKNWYEENERKVSSFSLLIGFVFDSLTLQRIDSLLDNLWLIANLIAIGVCIILVNRSDNLKEEEGGWKRFWLMNILQFSFGALLGASFIFYFRSAALAVSWPFLLLLLAALVGNEVFKKHYERLVFQISFLYLSLFVFMIFLLPVLIHKIGAWIFLLSGVLSVIVLWFFILVLNRVAKERFKQSWRHIWFSVVSIFILFNILYFTNLIPPIPLSLKDAGIYHNVEKLQQGGYRVLEEEERGLSRYLSLRQKIHLVPGNTVFAYSAIFSPADLDTDIIHDWQHYDEEGGGWKTETKIPLHLSGGRAEGYRTYSIKSHLVQGSWRVNVATPDGLLLGRINFEIIPSDNMPIIKALIKR